MNRTPIEWTDWTVNPLKLRMPDGTVINICVHKSEGCRFCYAEGIVRRWWKKEWGEFPGYTPALLKLGTPVLVEDDLRSVMRLSRRIAEGKANPKENKVFWNDMTDEFLEFWPIQFIDKLFAVRALTPNLIHQVLTKRANRMFQYFQKRNSDYTDLGVSEYAEDVGFEHIYENGELRQYLKEAGWWLDWNHDDETGKKSDCRPCYGGKVPLPNVWLGVSVEDQANANHRIPLLLQTPAAVRFISAEPLLGPVSFCDEWLGRAISAQRFPIGPSEQMFRSPLGWVIAGGESGPKARPVHPDWVRSLRDQCQASDVPFFFKQWGTFAPIGPINSDSEFDSADIDKTIAIHIDGSIGWRDDADPAWSKLQPFAMERLTKKRSGRQLDGREWNEFPSVISNLKSEIAGVAA